jgi:hypothetical protein
MIFQTIHDLKDYAGGAVNTGLPLSVLTPCYREARTNYLERYLSADFLDELEEAAADVATDLQTEAIEWVAPALAMLTLYQYSYIGSVQMGGEGLVTMEGERTKSAYKYQVRDYRDFTLAAGLNGLDTCLIKLQARATDFPVWSASRAAAYHRRVLIRTARDFGDLHNQVTDRRAYEAMRPLLADLHTFVAEACIGRPLLDRLLDALNADNATEQEAELIDRLQRALASFTVHESMRRNLVGVKGNRLVQYEALEPQSVEREGTPPARSLLISTEQNEEFAERYLSYVRDYLQQEAGSFPEYVTWLELSQPDPDALAFDSVPEYRRGAKVIRF